MRKLLPCLYQAHVAGLLHPEGRILGVSRSKFDTAEFLAKVETNSKIHIKNHFSEAQWQSFVDRITYLSLNVTEPEDFVRLGEAVKERAVPKDIVIYLSTAPKFFAQACENLAAVGLNADNVRVVLEKPLGTDLQSSREINDDVARFYREDQIYRIDHYLGKESLQNLLALRFANVVLEPLWNHKYIKSVQLTIAEQLGVEERGEFYDITGALRDMVQNHLLQMLCMTAMEPPASLDADAVRNEKVKSAESPETDDFGGCRQKRCPRPIYCRRGHERLPSGSQRTFRQHHRNLRCHPCRNRYAALGGRTVLSAHRQAHGR